MNQNIQKMFINYYIYGLFKSVYKLEFTVLLPFNMYIGLFDLIKNIFNVFCINVWILGANLTWITKYRCEVV